MSHRFGCAILNSPPTQEFYSMKRIQHENCVKAQFISWNEQIGTKLQIRFWQCGKITNSKL